MTLSLGVALVFSHNGAIDQSVPAIFEDLDQSLESIDQVSIFDCGPVLGPELLRLVVPEKYIPKVRYTQCFDLKGVVQSFESLQETESTGFVVIVSGLKQMVDREKLGDYTLTHKLLNDVMLQTRKHQSLGVNVLLLENEGESESVIDYYVDVRCVVRSGLVKYV